jgi:hypothetical protein
MGPAALPGGAGKARADRLDQTTVGIGDHQLHPRQAAGDQAPDERQPPRTVLGRGDLHPQNLPAPIGVHAGRDQHVNVDGRPALTDLLGQGVHPHERIRAGIQRPGAERGHLGVQDLAHLRDLALGDSLDPELIDQLVHPPRRDAQQVGGGHHRDQSLFGATTALQQPLWEVRAGPQLGDGQLNRPRTGIPLPFPVTVTPADPLTAAFAVAGPAHRIGFSAHQRLGHRLDHRPQQIRLTRPDLLGEPARRVHTVTDGHRVVPLR